MSETRPVVVVIDDDPDIRDALQDLLETVELSTPGCSLPPLNSWRTSARKVRAASSSISGSLA